MFEIKRVKEGVCGCGESATKSVCGELYCVHCGDAEIMKMLIVGVKHLEEVVVKYKVMPLEVYKGIIEGGQKVEFRIVSKKVEG